MYRIFDKYVVKPVVGLTALLTLSECGPKHTCSVEIQSPNEGMEVIKHLERYHGGVVDIGMVDFDEDRKLDNYFIAADGVCYVNLSSPNTKSPKNPSVWRRSNVEEIKKMLDKNEQRRKRDSERRFS